MGTKILINLLRNKLLNFDTNSNVILSSLSKLCHFIGKELPSAIFFGSLFFIFFGSLFFIFFGSLFFIFFGSGMQKKEDFK